MKVSIRCEKCGEVKDESSYLPGGVDYVCGECRIEEKKDRRRKNPLPDMIKEEEREVIFREDGKNSYVVFPDLPVTPGGGKCFVFVDQERGEAMDYNELRDRTDPVEEETVSQLEKFLTENAVPFSVKKRETKKNRRRRKEAAKEGNIVPVLPGADLPEVDIIVGCRMKYGNRQVIAVFPGVPGDERGQTCFARTLEGKSLSLSYELFKNSCEDPTEGEVDRLVEQLEDLGYNVQIKTRTSEKDTRTRRERAYVWYSE